MSESNFDPNDLIARLQTRFTNGLNTLRSIPEVSPGCTDRALRWERDQVQLFQYDRPHASEAVPLLICYAMVNRPGMLDLEPKRSLIRTLIAKGFDVWLIEWNEPRALDRYKTLADYVLGYLHECVETVCEQRECEKLNLLGVCQGGVFSLCYSALRPARIKNLITTVTPVDFHSAGDRLSSLVRDIDINALVDTFGNVPGAMLNSAFLGLKPYQLGMAKYVKLLDNMESAEALASFVRMEQWIFDSPAQPGSAFAEFVSRCYQDNALVKSELEIGGETVDLTAIQAPVLNVYAEADHLVPPPASRALSKFIPPQRYRELACPGGHIGIYVGSRAGDLLAAEAASWCQP